MRKTLPPLLALVIFFSAILAFSSCETDITVLAPAGTTPVVICILNQDSTTQYVRLSRSYAVTDATIPPDSPDSILFSKATKVGVEEVINGVVTNRSFFTPVELIKDSGFFPRQEHWVYKAEFKVKPETDYRLIIYPEETDEIVYSTCYTVGDFEIVNPLYPEVRYIHMLPDHNLSFYWTRSLNAAIYQLGFVMHYLEIGPDKTIEKEILIPLKSIFYLETRENLFSYPINSANFYNYLSEALPSDPALLRQCLSVDAVIISGGEELGYYMQLQEGGQTFSIIDYSNIKNGFGIFSSQVVRKINGFRLTEQSIDTLAYGVVTKKLNFVDRTGSRRGVPSGASVRQQKGPRVNLGTTAKRSPLPAPPREDDREGISTIDSFKKK
jgi:hypothetical protein